MKRKNRERRIFAYLESNNGNPAEVYDPRNGRTICRCPSETAARRICNALNAQEKAIATKPRS